MTFDTRDKKPNLWHLAALAGAVAILIGVLVLTGAEAHAIAITAILAAFFFAAVALLVIAFFQQLQYNPYSYNTIIYVGFALFFLSIAVTLILFLVQVLRHPEIYGETCFRNLVGTLIHAAISFMFLTFPFAVVFGVLLCVSNVALIRHEGRRPVYFLGILLAALMIGGMVFLFFWNRYVTGSEWEVMMHDLLVSLYASVYLYLECMLIGSIVASLIAARHRPARDKDVVIILGCGLQPDGTPTPLLRGRIDRALEFYRQQKAETGKELLFVPSGGKGSDEIISESRSMKNYLMEQGIPESQILEEDRSTDTLSNMRFSKEVIGDETGEKKIAFSTTNYHVFRGGICARRVKMRAVGMGAPTRWYFWPNAWVREFIGLLTEHRGKQLLIFAGLLVSFVLLTLLSYA